MATPLLEKPRFMVLTAPGVNRDFATQAAIEATGGAYADIITLSQIVETPQMLKKYHGILLPGGFSFRDDIQSGVIWALRMYQLEDEFKEHAFHQKKPIVGICNGFQALIQSGLLPFGEMTTRNKLQATLTNNDSVKFESRWIRVKPQKSVCLFVDEDEPMTFPVAHGEGKFVTSEKTYTQLEANRQIVWRYVDTQGNPTQEYPDNPNGSLYSVAGITDPTGVIFGGMPHPEDFIRPHHLSNWRRNGTEKEPDGLLFFKQVVLYTKGL